MLHAAGASRSSAFLTDWSFVVARRVERGVVPVLRLARTCPRRVNRQLACHTGRGRHPAATPAPVATTPVFTAATAKLSTDRRSTAAGFILIGPVTTTGAVRSLGPSNHLITSRRAAPRVTYLAHRPARRSTRAASARDEGPACGHRVVADGTGGSDQRADESARRSRAIETLHG